MLCIEGRITRRGAMAVSLSPNSGVNGSLNAQGFIKSVLSADVATVTMTSQQGIRALLTASPIEANISTSDRIKAALTRHDSVEGSLTHRGGITGTLTAKDGINGSLQVNPIVTTLTKDGDMDVSLTSVPVNAFFSFSCPIDSIKSSFSLGGWNNDLGWDNDLGWKD